MIVNSPVSAPQSSTGIMDNQQCESFYLKRKLGPDEPIDNHNGYIQAKKRHLQDYSPTDHGFHPSSSDESPQQQQQNCNDLHFNLNTSAFINDLFSYDNNLVPVQSNFSTDQFDGNWQNTDLLELDHRYNSGLAALTQETHQSQVQQDVANNNAQMNQMDLQQQNLSVFTPPKQSSVSDGTSRRPYNADPESDFEDKNLSWLFNFKLDELPHLSPEVNPTQPQPSATKNTSSENASKSQSSKVQSKTGKKFEELVMEVTSDLDGNDMIVGENVIIENSPRMPKKPPFTYTELIEYALEDKGELTVSGIYQWISDRFPFYKSNDDRWKNSVRHNLSINPHFRKGAKAPQGAGHLWTISSGDSEENILAWEHKKQRLDLFFKMESMHREKSASSPHTGEQSQPPAYDEAAIAAATIAQELQNMSPSQSSTSCSPSTCDRLGASSASASHDLPFHDLMSDDDLRKTAGQILNGMHREVEVQAVNSIISTYHDALLDTEDYLNPIQKDVSVHESSLRNDFYVTEIDPIELGIQMSQVEEEVLFNDEFNLNYFGYNTGNDIVA